MKDGPNIARIATLIGDHTRAEVLSVLMADRALTATELAHMTGVTKQTISTHLAKLQEGGLISMQAQGRHRYFRIAHPDVAHLLEALMGVAFRAGAVRVRSSPREGALRKARVCYDHLAGELGVRSYEAMQRAGLLIQTDAGLELSATGHTWFAEMGIATEPLQHAHRSFCRACLDWSERRHHLAGSLGAALLQKMLALGWASRVPDSRVVAFTAQGEQAFVQRFGEERSISGFGALHESRCSG